MRAPFLKKFFGILVACTLLSPLLSVQASISDEPTTIILEKRVYFLGTDGSPVIADAGQYTVEAAEEWIKLIPGKERENALLLESEKGTHEVGAEIPIALSIPGDNAAELNLHYVQLLLPDGTSLEANGTYDGVRPRGWASKAKARAKKAAARARARAAAKASAARATAARTAESARIAAIKAKQEAERLANETAAKAAYFAQQATIQTCKTYFQAQAKKAELQKKGYAYIEGAVEELKKNTKFVRDAAAAADQVVQQYEDKIRELALKALDFNNPINLKKIASILQPNNICEKGFPTTHKEFMALMGPDTSGIRSRGAGDWVLSLGGQAAGVSPWAVGVEGGLGVAFQAKDFSDGLQLKDFHVYRFVGPTVSVPGLKGSVVIQVPWWNPQKVKTIGDLKGGYFAVGVTIPWQLIFNEEKHIPGQQGVPGYTDQSSFGVGIDFVWAWPKGQAFPDFSRLAGIVASPGWTKGLSKQFKPASSAGWQRLQDVLTSITLQGGYTWVD